MRPYWIGAVLFGVLFSTLMAVRVDLLGRMAPLPTTPPPRVAAPERDNWMQIIQNNRKIGYSHSSLSRLEDGYRLTQTMVMRINTMGMVQDVRLKTDARLAVDFTLTSFHFRLNSGRFNFTAAGSVSGTSATVRTESAGTSQTFTVPVKRRPFLAAGLFQAVHAAGLAPGRERTFYVFDPSTLSQEPVRVAVLGRDEQIVMGESIPALRLLLDYKGMTQEAWLDDAGDVIKQSGFLGITLLRSDREGALGGLPIEASEDLTRIAAVPSNRRLADPSALQRLAVQIRGIPTALLGIDGGRQTLSGDRLTIEKERLDGLPRQLTEAQLGDVDQRLLLPTPFIQSDHPRITALSETVAAGRRAPVDQIRAFVAWIQDNIERRPVVSIPDALATLENKAGDCNEHAVLLAALARAAGIPADIEVGLVYLDGRFYYHAWNRVFIGKWVTVDALFNQMPADVTHIRFSSGDPERQMDLMQIIGKVELTIVDATEDGAS